MRNDEQKTGWIFAMVGVVPVVWFALLTAPYVSGGLPEIIQELPKAINHPFHIEYCEDSVKTVLIFLVCYGMGLGIYLSTKKNYRKGEEHGSAKWGDAQNVNKKYADRNFSTNKIMTMHVSISYNMRKHLRNVLTLVIGGSGAGKMITMCRGW